MHRFDSENLWARPKEASRRRRPSQKWKGFAQGNFVKSPLSSAHRTTSSGHGLKPFSIPVGSQRPALLFTASTFSCRHSASVCRTKNEQETCRYMYSLLSQPRSKLRRITCLEKNRPRDRQPHHRRLLLSPTDQRSSPRALRRSCSRQKSFEASRVRSNERGELLCWSREALI